MSNNSEEFKCLQGQEQEKTIVTKIPASDIKKKKKGKSTSAVISTEINQTFKELKGRVIALRARELRILAGIFMFICIVNV